MNTWDDFRTIVKEIRDRYGRRKRTGTKNDILFRGMASANWPLHTTLERCTEQEFSVKQYMNYATRCSNELESITGRKWGIPSFPALIKEMKTLQNTFRVNFPCYDYLIYLRHHGFPSPLMDWTTSPYIAAYFAYYEKSSADRIAVYVYIERPSGDKGFSENTPKISLQGPYVSTHSRHFVQKAWYTIATKYDSKRDEHLFCNHSLIFDRAKQSIVKDQDTLIKITLPSSERLCVLEELNDYNINHYTLFQTEDALIKTLAIREFELKNK